MSEKAGKVKEMSPEGSNRVVSCSYSVVAKERDMVASVFGCFKT